MAPDLVQENGPGGSISAELYGQLDELLPPDVIIASSSSGLTMSEIQKGATSHPERWRHRSPVQSAHLIPLVEIVASEDLRKRRSGARMNFTLDRSADVCASTRKCPAMSPTVCRRR